jgi:hypothetical protein
MLYPCVASDQVSNVVIIRVKNQGSGNVDKFCFVRHWPAVFEAGTGDGWGRRY